MYRDHDVIFMQEISWGLIKRVPSAKEPEGDEFEHTTRHRNFMCLGAHKESSVCIHVNKRWEHLMPRLADNLIKHDDVCAVSLTTREGPQLLINVYNQPKTHAGSKYLEGRADRLPSVLTIAGDFNLHSGVWGPSGASYQKAIARDRDDVESVIDVMASLNLELANYRREFTWQSHNEALRPQVIDLVWVPILYTADANCRVHLHDTLINSDHAVLTWEIPLEAMWPMSQPRIKEDSPLEEVYVNQIGEALAALFDEDWDPDTDSIDDVADELSEVMREAWDSCSSEPNFAPGKSRSWWNAECKEAATQFRSAKLRRVPDENGNDRRERIARCGKRLKGAARRARREFFDKTIAKVENTTKMWDLVAWTRKKPDDAFSTLIQADGTPAATPEDIFKTFKETFYPTMPNPIDPTVVDTYPQLPTREWAWVSAAEILSAVKGTSNTSTPGLDHCGWRLLKKILAVKDAAEGAAKFLNECFRSGTWPEMFKVNITVVIPKPGKDDYSKAKSYRPIVLLNCLGKAFEKVIATRLQFQGQKYGVIHPNQFGGTIQNSTVDAGVHVVHHVLQARRKGLVCSMLLFDIAQFYPSINHDLLGAIMSKQGFHPRYVAFFDNYLKDRKTKIRFQKNFSEDIDTPLGVGQGSALSPILSGLYIAAAIHKWAGTDARIKMVDDDREMIIDINGCIMQFYVDDGAIVVTSATLETNAVLLAKVFKGISTDLERLGLRVERTKNELVHFLMPNSKRWEQKDLGPDVTIDIEGVPVVVKPSAKIRYLGFILDQKLQFKDHVKLQFDERYDAEE
ncbi:hypothetical protein EUX98_g9226 [Antrodiella citrinella]|uniref:Reverse transcriptase domain-containing protein n=1 Tax=Antrodiella citrinella TaxID=2447956 RepID=A0A4S4LWE9_9APHY|nr:hypothetical protein EUX98_g9226 [Antrodiella citrinella]